MKTWICGWILMFSGPLYALSLDEPMQDGFSTVMSLTDVSPRAAVIHLLNWKDSLKDPQPPAENYSREKHFGGWISIRDDRSCLNVRNRVLVRDSSGKVELFPDNPCRIKSGIWHDDYTTEVLKDPNAVDVDHMVPLKNAYINGAWKWNADLRCLYANYMGNEIHLKAVESRQNIIKGDRDPSQYMPPNQQYSCDYLKNWLSIKLIWKLGLQRDEAKAIRALVQEKGCNPDEFVFPVQELSLERQKIQSLVHICASKIN